MFLSYQLNYTEFLLTDCLLRPAHPDLFENLRSRTTNYVLNMVKVRILDLCINILNHLSKAVLILLRALLPPKVSGQGNALCDCYLTYRGSMSPASDVQEGNSFKVTCGRGTTDITNTNPVGPCAFGVGVGHCETWALFPSSPGPRSS